MTIFTVDTRELSNPSLLPLSPHTLSGSGGRLLSRWMAETDPASLAFLGSWPFPSTACL